MKEDVPCCLVVNRVCECSETRKTDYSRPMAIKLNEDFGVFEVRELPPTDQGIPQTIPAAHIAVDVAS